MDSLPGDEHWSNTTIPSFVSIFDNPLATASRAKQNLRRTPSAPLRGSAELFRGSHIRCDIPFYTEGIELLNFQRIGTINIPRIRSGSDPSCTIGIRAGAHISSARSHSNLYGNQSCDSSGVSSGTPSPGNSPPRNSILENVDDSPIRRNSPEPVSFENMCRETDHDILWEEIKEPSCDVDDLSEVDLKKLQPFLWLELAALFDRHHVSLDKRKPFKRKRKEGMLKQSWNWSFFN